MAKKPDTQAFLAAMQGTIEQDEPPPAPPKPAAAEPAAAPAKAQPTAKVRSPKRQTAKPPRAELKHFGGYLGDATLEKIALLRVRLKLDNSELIALAIDELHRKHTAKRAFGDA